ncbi:SOS-induced cell division inhibitor SulA [Pseudomonas paraeruginosa]|uniref:SOS-induced cell division inhibitor SulA n=1 Tax=Pseudomonas paraeruginosa TaxID=2994495 RepID=UPI0039FD3979
MQTSHSLPSAQLPLFQEAFWASNGAPLLDDVIDSPSNAEEPTAFSELSLSGLPGHCLNLLAPILRELSEEQEQSRDARWLTLIAPPASLTHEWLRRAGLNRERILLLQAKDNASALALSCEALRLGRSHTVVSWLEPLGRAARRQLSRAAQQGQAQSLNIRLG